MNRPPEAARGIIAGPPARSNFQPLNYSPTGRFLTGGFALADFDQDDDVDQADFNALSDCFTGPDVPVDRDLHPGCVAKNLDGDLMPGHDTGDVDGEDYILFQACMSGPDVRPPQHCTAGGAPPPGTFALHGLPVDVFSDPAGGRHALLFVRARHYDLDNGRWLQRDPIAYADGSNLYEAFGNNPLVRLDPGGLDSVKREGEWLGYYSSGFTWNFAQIIYPGIVVIDHPRWPLAFIMREADAIALFDTDWTKSDMFSPEEVMLHASYLAHDTGTRSKFIAIFDKRQKRPGWVSPDRPSNETYELLHRLHNEALHGVIGDVGDIVQVAFQVSMGTLAAGGGLAATVVEGGAAAADVATGKTSVGSGALVITAAVAGVLLHFTLPTDEFVDAARAGQVAAGRSGGTIAEGAGSVARNAQRNAHGWSARSVNAVARGSKNCASCAVAMDATLAGHAASAMKSGLTYTSALESQFGRKFVRGMSVQSLESTMSAAGPGSRGIVFGFKGVGKEGHYFNVVNQRGTVRFIDAQTGKAARLVNGYVDFWLLRTN